MDYVTQAQMRAMVPAEYIDQALNDDGEDGADRGVWTEISQAVADAIEGPLGRRFAVPFAEPFPATVRQAARVLCAELLFLRRGLSGEQNPWTKAADAVRTQLDEIGAGKAPLSPDHDKAAPSGTIISEPARTHSTLGRLSL